MSSIDDRIVSIKFDNGSFEKRIEETLRSLDKLRNSLNFDGAGKSLQNVSDSAKRLNFGPMSASIEEVSARMLALGTVAFQVISRITNMALDSGTKIVKALSLDPVLQGFQEYEVNMNSIQTILANTASKGATLDDVNKALDQLNEYSDQTIYNFSQMAKNIGTFTAAGVGLQESVNAIKGIANLAAISGSNSQQASTAMYQLSQALAAGRVNLMDWNSVVNAGMGGEVFKTALFETGKAMRTITDVPLSASFDEWEEKGGTFRDQMQEGWLTAEVLSTTLEAFSGDLDHAALTALGFSDAAASEMVRLGELGIRAATEVKTITQLMGTVKEAIGSGWSATFRILIGNFEQAKDLFTEINDVIGGFVSASADARNELLGGWAWLGGRITLLESLRNIFQTLSYVMNAAKTAFRDVFPKSTSLDLLAMTDRFKEFTTTLQQGVARNLPKIRTLFQGLFSAISIVMEVFRGFGNVIRRVFLGVTDDIDGASVLDFFVNLAETIIDLKRVLVDDNALYAFFNRIATAIQNPEQAIHNLKIAFTDLFEKIGEVVGFDISGVFDNMGDSTGFLSTVVDGLVLAWDRFTGLFDGITGVLDTIWTEISEWFSSLGERIANAIDSTDFNAAVDLINVGLLGGILLVLRDFFQNGIDIDFTGGVFDSVNGALGQLTDTLATMQAEIKTDALLKLAGAIAILTGSVAILALIDSDALTKALTAVAVGFGQLALALAVMTHISTGIGASKMVLIAGGLVLLATAAGILSLAVRNLSGLGWEELAKGLAGVTTMLVALSVSANLISGNTSGLVRAGIGMIGISVALLILSAAVKSFADLEWDELARGLVGASVGLLAITLAMRAMPVGGMIAAGIGVTAIAGGLLILSYAVKSFSDMNWGEMAKGLIGITIGLGAIVLLTNLMPAGGLVAIGAGLILVSVALNIMADAVSSMGALSLEEMAKGIGGLAVLLGILAIATNAMSGSAPGAAAIVLVSGALYILAEVLVKLSDLSIAQIATGLGAIAATFVILGVAGYALAGIVPVLVSLGYALLLVGAGFALFGLGAGLLAEAFKVVAESGERGIEALLNIMELIIDSLPRLLSAIALGVMGFLTEVFEAAPVLIEGFGVLVSSILDKVIELVPKIVETAVTFVTQFLGAIRELAPDFVETGLTLLIAILTGIRDNIAEITVLVSEIIQGFLTAFTEEVPDLVTSLVELLQTVFEEVALGLGTLVPTILIGVGRAFLEGFWTGITEELGKLLETITNIIGDVVNKFKELLGIQSPSTVMMDIGVNLIQGLINGVTSMAGTLLGWFIGLPGQILGTLSGIFGTLIGTGLDLIGGLLQGITDKFRDIKDWFWELPGTVLGAIPNPATALLSVGRSIMNGLWDGLKDIWEDITGWLNDLTDLIPFEKGPPARDAILLVETGHLIMQGLYKGMDREWEEIAQWLNKINPADEINDDSLNNFNSAFKAITDHLQDLDEFNPTITPVLDLSNVDREAQNLSKLLSVGAINATVSTDQANLISHTTEEARHTPTPEEDPLLRPTEVKFEQNIYSPTRLSANDIYRQTKSQIAQAKEELNLT